MSSSVLAGYHWRMINPRALVLIVATSAALHLAPESADACDVAPDHQVEVILDDTPECVTVTDAFNYGSGALRIDNQCEDTLTIAPTDCEACGASIDIIAGTEEWYDIETRTVADGLAEGTVTAATVSWTLVDQSGTIEAEVAVYDNSDACDDWDGGRGCAVGSGHGSGAAWLILCVIGLLAGSRRSRRRRS